jgi:hypothetical protein
MKRVLAGVDQLHPGRPVEHEDIAGAEPAEEFADGVDVVVEPVSVRAVQADH